MKRLNELMDFSREASKFWGVVGAVASVSGLAIGYFSQHEWPFNVMMGINVCAGLLIIFNIWRLSRIAPEKKWFERWRFMLDPLSCAIIFVAITVAGMVGATHYGKKLYQEHQLREERVMAALNEVEQIIRDRATPLYEDTQLTLSAWEHTKNEVVPGDVKNWDKYEIGPKTAETVGMCRDLERKLKQSREKFEPILNEILDDKNLIPIRELQSQSEGFAAMADLSRQIFQKISVRNNKVPEEIILRLDNQSKNFKEKSAGFKKMIDTIQQKVAENHKMYRSKTEVPMPAAPAE